jgi:hypothetical protein
MAKIFQTVVKRTTVIQGGNVPPGAAVMSDSIAFFAELSANDSVPGQQETASFDLTANYTDSNAGQAESVNFGFDGYLDANQGQSEIRNSLLTRWVTVTATGGSTAPTNPTNAQGQNNGTVATCKAGGLAAGTSILTCTIAAPFSEIASGSTRTLVAYYSFAAGTGDSITAQVSYRQAGQGANTTLNLPATGNFLTTPATLSLTNIDPSQNVVITYTHSATVPATGGSLTVDATGIQTSGVI